MFLEVRAEMRIENRKFKRFVVKERGFVAFRPEFTKLGRIIDISRGGLGCEYFVYKDFRDGDEEPLSSEIDIFLSNNTFYASRIPCSVAYDIEIARNETTFAGITENRRCGVKFGKLREEQNRQLEVFIRNYAGEGQ